MKIIHITQYCHVESIGGTERFIVDLIHELDVLGHTSAIGWLTLKNAQQIVLNGIRIIPLPGVPMRVDKPAPRLLSALDDLAASINPDIIHFHTFGRSEATIAKWARLRGIPYVFTYHSPGWTCRREDLMIFNGTKPCDGEVRTFRCSACKLHERLRYAPVWFAWVAMLVSLPISVLLARCTQTSFRRRTAFIADTWAFRRELRSFLKRCSIIFACAEWSIPVLLRNGALRQMVQLCPQGVSKEMALTGEHGAPVSFTNKSFTIGYVGRVVSVKGVDILVEGFRKLVSKDVGLRIYGWPEVVPKDSLCDYIKRAAEEDPRIRLVPRLPMAEMVKEYSSLDLLCIPSVWLETGPLVLFEALQKGIPVYGSSRVGQLELLKSRGLVVEPNTSEQWHSALESAYQKYRGGMWGVECVRALGDERVRTMEDVVIDVLKGYSLAKT